MVVGAFRATLDGFVITQGRTTGAGAGMWNEWSEAGRYGDSLVANSVFLDNRAGAGGGLYNGPEARVDLINVAFIDNWADEYGGGLANWVDSHAELVNTLFIGNSAGVQGGAISSQRWSSMYVVNSTLVDNSAPRGGGLDMDESGWAYIFNTIFWGNTAASGAQIFSAGEYLELAYSDLEGGLAGIAGPGWVEDGGGNISENPLFADVSLRDYRLTGNSPCVDAAPSGPLFDLDGKPRPLDGDRDGHTAFDIGAYELPEPSTFTLIAIGAVTLLTFGRWRRRRAAACSPAG